MIARLPDIGVKSVALAALPVSSRRDTAGVVWLRLKDGAVVADGSIPDSSAVGVLLPFDEAWSVRLAAAERLRHQFAGRSVPAPITPQRRERLKRALRTIDARRQGASYRDIAVAYFGERRVAKEHWKTSALKAQVARLAAHGRMLIDRGYRHLLQGKLR
ncbi:DUF2285 domain-containing protein [Inquilinus sp. CAU 1745]|uniref:DUF2285 domain-containing protein n=1 Tax=Inquilinus sp. CAU 1745 TaxID=3140369 RepID=UPI00325A6D0D